MEKVDVSPSDGFSQVYDSMNTKFVEGANPMVLVMLSVIIIFYFVVFSYLGYSVKPVQTESSGMKFIEIVMWGLLIFLVLINGIQYFFQIDVETAVKNLFKEVPEVDVKIKPEKEYVEKKGKDLVEEVEKDLGLGNLKGGSSGKQVFNISGNDYTYNEAKALCKAYGAKLATYSQIENAYKSGAEWCNYGWSEDQMALYPTQISTWRKLKKIKGHEHDCGRPGVNGGFIKNKNVRFGVNCYGNKPAIREDEQKLMKTATPYPLTPKDKKINALVKKYKSEIDNIMVSPFNYKNWSQA